MKKGKVVYEAPGVDLKGKNGWGIEELDQFQAYFGDEYQIIIYAHRVKLFPRSLLSHHLYFQ